MDFVTHDSGIFLLAVQRLDNSNTANVLVKVNTNDRRVTTHSKERSPGERLPNHSDKEQRWNDSEGDYRQLEVE